jgi:hypothetical protein
VNLVEMTLVHGHGMWWIFANRGGCEAGHVVKCPSSIAAHHVERAGENRLAW